MRLFAKLLWTIVAQLTPTHRQTDTQTTLRETYVAIGHIFALGLRAGDAE